MDLPLDHIVLSVGSNLDKAIADFRELGFTVLVGGVHASGATHNALIWFANGTFIELMALTGDPPKAGEADYTPIHRSGEGVVGICLRSVNLAADSAKMRAEGVNIADPVESGRVRPDGVRLAWKLGLIDNWYTPFIIEHIAPPDDQRLPQDAAITTHANGVTRACSADAKTHTVVLESAHALTFDSAKTHGVTFTFIAKC